MEPVIIPELDEASTGVTVVCLGIDGGGSRREAETALWPGSRA